MIDIDDEGIIISVYPSGEHGAVVTVMSREHGIIKGYVNHISKAKRGEDIFHPANRVRFHWHARLENNLGNLTAVLLTGYAYRYLADKIKMAVLMSATAMIYSCFKEREKISDFYDRTLELFTAPSGRNYLLWEILLLQTSGFGLDLTECAVTGKKNGLEYVSPKSGRAVSKEGAGEYLKYLLPLPAFYTEDNVAVGKNDIKNGFSLSGYFFRKCLFVGHKMPEIRDILEEYLLKEEKSI